MPRPPDRYHTDAKRLAALYETVSFEDAHGPWLHLLPGSPPGRLALDVGAGSGRDAAGLASRGFEVVAVEPAGPFRAEAERLHPGPGIRWLDDRLPGLAAVHALDLRFGLILVSAVWMHVPPGGRERAFRRLTDLLAPGGLLVFTLRHGDPHEGMFPTDEDELNRLARRSALDPVRLAEPESADHLGRPQIRWTTHVYRLPDDGTP